VKVTRSPIAVISDITIDADIDMNSHGFTELGDMTPVKNTGLKLLAALGVDGDWSGSVVEAVAGEDVDAGENIYLKSDGKCWLSQANSANTMPIKGICTADVLADATGVLLIEGFIRKDAWNWTIGQVIYASDVTAGDLIATVPDTSGDQVQPVGIAVSADSIFFSPDLTMLEIT